MFSKMSVDCNKIHLNQEDDSFVAAARGGWITTSVPAPASGNRATSSQAKHGRFTKAPG